MSASYEANGPPNLSHSPPPSPRAHTPSSSSLSLDSDSIQHLLRPLHGEHYPSILPFELGSDIFSDVSSSWHAAMIRCGYSSEDIADHHYFTKSIAYYPNWKTRIIRKNEHRLDRESNKIATRERWAVQFYYGGGPREQWDEVVSADWDGEELDEACENEEVWVETLLGVIQAAEKIAAVENYGKFLKCMTDLAECIEACEAEVWGVVDPGRSRVEEVDGGVMPEWRVEQEPDKEEVEHLWTYCELLNELLDDDDVRRLW